MKKLAILIPFFLVLAIGMNAQPGLQTKQHYTVGDLDKLGKLELANIYIGQVQKLTLLIPYVPFNQKGETVSLSGMGIPSTKDNNGYIKALDASGSSHNETLDETLNNILPYSDKADIIRAILFIQDVVERIENGV